LLVGAEPDVNPSRLLEYVPGSAHTVSPACASVYARFAVKHTELAVGGVPCGSVNRLQFDPASLPVGDTNKFAPVVFGNSPAGGVAVAVAVAVGVGVARVPSGTPPPPDPSVNIDMTAPVVTAAAASPLASFRRRTSSP
jgi:hypothetical protein